MALFRNFGVKLRGSLCDVLSYVSAQPLVFLDLAENRSFLNWKLRVPTVTLMNGHKIVVSYLSLIHLKMPGYSRVRQTGTENNAFCQFLQA